MTTSKKNGHSDSLWGFDRGEKELKLKVDSDGLNTTNTTNTDTHTGADTLLLLFLSRLTSQRTALAVTTIGVLGIGFVSLVYGLFGYTYNTASTTASFQNNLFNQCYTVDGGFNCSPNISHKWGQRSPYYSLDGHPHHHHDNSNDTITTIPSDIPDGCQITLVQVLSRHGARYPSKSKGKTYAKLIRGIQRNVTATTTAFRGKYAFLNTYRYSLGADNLTAFGERQMVDSGAKFYGRYREFVRGKGVVPFVRASGSSRVVASAEMFLEGYQKAMNDDDGDDGSGGNNDGNGNGTTTGVDVILDESHGSNNTLDHSTCTRFENDKLTNEVVANFSRLFVPPIRDRLQSDLPGVHLSISNVVSLMDMCPFDTVAGNITTTTTTLSPFCSLFTENEWTQYDYLQSLTKYYGYASGNPLGPTQGIGFTNELIARLTKSPVRDETTVNHTLDSDPATFPLPPNNSNKNTTSVYADFSHDNSMISIFFALGLYNGTRPLSRGSVQSAIEMDGYSAGWTVPFGGRAYFEVMRCENLGLGQRQTQTQSGTTETSPSPPLLVRALINDRVVPLHGCAVDELGRCELNDFVSGLSFAESGGNWGECFV